MYLLSSFELFFTWLSVLEFGRVEHYTWVGAMVLILFALSFDHWVVKLTGVAHMVVWEGY